MAVPATIPNLMATDVPHIRDLADDARSRVQRDTPRFKKLYAKRIVVEQNFSRLQDLEIEKARHYSLTAIRNANTIDYLALALVA